MQAMILSLCHQIKEITSGSLNHLTILIYSQPADFAHVNHQSVKPFNNIDGNLFDLYRARLQILLVHRPSIIFDCTSLHHYKSSSSSSFIDGYREIYRTNVRTPSSSSSRCWMLALWWTLYVRIHCRCSYEFPLFHHILTITIEHSITF